MFSVSAVLFEVTVLNAVCDSAVGNCFIENFEKNIYILSGTLSSCLCGTARCNPTHTPFQLSVSRWVKLIPGF